MAQDRLRREIESLLRGYWRAGLLAGVLREPVLGSRSIAVPPWRDSEPSPIILDIEMWHGWLAGLRNPAWGPEVITDPPLVWTTEHLQTYWSGAGSSLPNTGTEYISGWMTATGSTVHWPDADSDTGNSIVGNPPTIETDGSYPWYMSLVDPSQGVNDNPAMWTGLAKLRAQAMRGRNKLPAYNMPSGWDNPKEIGIIRSPIDNVSWYAVKLNSQGLLVCRLIIPDRWASVAQWISDGLITDEDDFIKIEAFLLCASECEKDTNGDPVITELLSGASVQALIGDAGPWSWGWYWKTQMFGGVSQDTPGAICVLGGEEGSGSTWTIRSRVARVAFTWESSDNGYIPVASLSSESESEWVPRLGEDRLYLPGEPTYWGWVKPSSNAAATATGGPVVAWYDTNDSEKIERYQGTSSFTRSYTADWLSLDGSCTPGTRTGTAGVESGYTCGWLLSSGGVSPEIVTGKNITTNTYHLIEAEPEPLGHPGNAEYVYRNGAYYWDYGGNSCTQPFSLGGFSSLDPPPIDMVTSFYGEGSGTTSMLETFVNGTGGNVLVIGHVPGCWWHSQNREVVWTGYSLVTRVATQKSNRYCKILVNGTPVKYFQYASNIWNQVTTVDTPPDSNTFSAIACIHGTIYTDNNPLHWGAFNTPEGSANADLAGEISYLGTIIGNAYPGAEYQKSDGLDCPNTGCFIGAV